MNEILLKPVECSKIDLIKFHNLLVKNRDIKRLGLKKRLLQSIVLLFHYEKNDLAGIGAIKKPGFGYINKIYKLANIDKTIYELKYEIGYLYIIDKYRKKGISKDITLSLIEYSNNDLFAVIRADNIIAENNLVKFGFKKIGNDYQGKNNFFKVFYRIKRI
jgi:GNAT superfamily N-acetyltransferase